MQDFPGLEVGDHLLDDIANLVDLSVEVLLPVQQVPMDGLLDAMPRSLR